MYLASLEQLRDQINFDDMTDINDAIGSALDDAENALATMLQTQFGRGTATDLFWVDEPTVVDPPAYWTEFKLSNGFLAEAPTITISSHNDLSDPADLTGVLTDVERGISRDTRTRFYRQFVQFEYTYGFEAAEDSDVSYDLTTVPRWLQDAAKKQALIFLSNTSVFQRTDMKVDVKELRLQLSEMLAVHQRYSGAGLLPM